MSKPIGGLRGVALGVAFALSASMPAGAANLPDAVKTLIQPAQKEGKALVWGTTLNPRQIAELNKAFNGFYGTKIKIGHVGGRQDIKAKQMAFAFKKGVPTGADVFWTPVPKSLIDANALVPMNWVKEFGIDPSLQMGKFGLKTHHSTSLFMTLNTNLIKPGEGPKKYEDLLDPKWRGKIAIPRSAFPWFLFSYAYGEEKATKMLNGLLTSQKAKLLPRYHDVLARVVGGEFAIGMATDSFTNIEKGAPVRHANLDAVVVNSAGAFILADSKSKNVAKLWGYWAVSNEGQKALERVRGYSLVSTKGSKLHEYTKSRKVHRVPLGWRMKNQGRLVGKYVKMIKASRGRR